MISKKTKSSYLRLVSNEEFDFSDVITQKSSESQESEELWGKALGNARQTLSHRDLKNEDLVSLAKACKKVRQFEMISRYFYQWSKSRPQTESVFQIFLEKVDRSPFDISEWIEGVEKLCLWLQNNDKEAEFQDMLGYLECCAISPDYVNVHQDLNYLVEDMLDVHGFERAKKKA